MRAINPDLGPDPTRRLTDHATRTEPMSRFELHAIFREAVRWQLSRGGLSTRQRRQLVQYAAGLRISVREAGELIQEAVRAHHGPEAAQKAEQPRLRLAPPDRPGWPTWAKLGSALLLVLVTKVALDWLLGG